MALSEADTHSKLVNPAIYGRGWTEDHIKREETTGAVEIIAGKARRRTRGRTDLTLRVVVTAAMQPVAVLGQGAHQGVGESVLRLGILVEDIPHGRAMLPSSSWHPVH